MKKKVALEVISYVFIFLFVYTAASKIISHRTFVSNIEHSDAIAPFAMQFSIMVPVVELAVAALLLFSKTRRLGMWSSLLLMSVFTIYVALILSFAKELPCSCGGIISHLSWPQHLVLNILLTAAAVWGVLLVRRGNINPPNTQYSVLT